jgi:hypothetical protein
MILARFGYRLDINVGKKNKKKKTGSVYILGLPTGTYHRKSGNLEILSFKKKNLANIGSFFFPRKILCIGQNYIFQVVI